jgi:hypothetical protein
VCKFFKDEIGTNEIKDTQKEELKNKYMNAGNTAFEKADDLFKPETE